MSETHFPLFMAVVVYSDPGGSWVRHTAFLEPSMEALGRRVCVALTEITQRGKVVLDFGYSDHLDAVETHETG